MEEDSITIMVVRQSGKIRTVKIAPRKLYVFFSGLTGLVLAFFVLLYGYIEAYQRNSGLSTTVRSILESKQEPSAERQPSFDMQEDARTMESSNTAAEIEEEEPPPDPRETSESTVPPENEIQASQAEGSISIDEFRVNKVSTPQGMKFSFRLSNVEQERALTGFLAVIGSSDTGRGRTFAAFPEAQVGNDGKLTDYRLGDWFSIRRFKYVQGILPLTDRISDYSQLSIYVYSEDGKLLLHKTMDVPTGAR